MIISFEGLDGSGKSTQIRMLSEKLEMIGKKYTVLREPGGNSISENIRQILLDKNNYAIENETELLLYIASRIQLVKNCIIPLLNDGNLIILDRFADSTTAYQGYGRGMDLKVIRFLNNFATIDGKYMPDITFFLDMETDASLSRMESRGEEINRMESADSEFFKKVRNGFIEISKNEPGRVIRINAANIKEKVFSDIESVLKERNII
ncbi:MAG TPA: dTMP kinase [Clostridiales bacterium]|nr:dTMP kinase [Clostridiales bacterium]HQP69541.1 dTMP kinase [Clostridiales bacterium]